MDLYPTPKKSVTKQKLSVHRISYVVETDFQDQNLMNTKDLKKTKWQYTSTFGTCYCIILLKIVFIWFYYKLMKVCYIILYTVWYQIIKLIYYLYIYVP